MDRDTSNFKDDILKVAGEEPIEAIVISDPRGFFAEDKQFDNEYGHWDNWKLTSDHAGRIMGWDEAAPLLDVAYDSGYGGQDCPSIYAWTPTRVLVVGLYDGSTWITSVPRNPTEGNAHSIGGG